MSKCSPDWFNLRKYDGLRKIPLHQWFRQLHIRQVLYNCLYNDFDASHASIHFWMEQIKTNTELCCTDLSLWIEIIKNNPVLPAYDYGSIDSRTVKPLSAEEIYVFTQEEGLETVWKECDEKWDSFGLDEDADAYKSADKLMYDLYGDTNGNDQCFFHVSVDLEATDEQIVNDFKYWLSETRQEYHRKAPRESPDPKRIKKKKKFSEKDMNIWTNDRLIQYLDLKIVSAFDQEKIENDDFGEILYPEMDGDDKGGKSRRTVKGKALLLISNETMKALASQLRITS